MTNNDSFPITVTGHAIIKELTHIPLKTNKVKTELRHFYFIGFPLVYTEKTQNICQFAVDFVFLSTQNLNAYTLPMDSRIKVLLILVIVLVGTLVYALTPDDFTISLKKIDLASLSADTTDVADTIAAEKPDTVKKVDENPHRILFFGDSMVEGLMRRFCDYAGHNGHELDVVCWYSSTSDKWANTGTLEHYIKEYSPTFIVVCLCGNELFVRDLPKREENIKKIISIIDTIPFVWVSPPNWKDDTGINDLIIKHVGKERYFDSRHLELERGKDHAHPTFSAAAIWMDTIAVWMRGMETAHPIKMDKPTEKHKATHQILLSPSYPGANAKAAPKK